MRPLLGAVLIVGMRVAAMAGAEPPAPAAPGPVTDASFNLANIAAERADLVGPFRGDAPAGAPWVEDGVKLLEDGAAWYVDWGDVPDSADLAVRAEGLIDRGCADGAILYFFALTRDGGRDLASSGALFARAEAALTASAYPARHLAVIRSRLAGLHAKFQESEEAARAYDRAVEAWVKSAHDQSVARVDPRRMLRQMNKWVLTLLPREVSRRMLDAMLADQNIDRWLCLTLDGFWHWQSGWDSRGGGAADSVNEAGWAGFHEHLGKAEDLLEEAYNLAPDRPEPAAWQINVQMALHPVNKRISTEWFDRAVKAQFDYGPAYEYYMWALRPRWGGSHDKMREFGERCRDTKRYDTAVPALYCRALLDICEETGAYPATFRDEATYAAAKEVLEKSAAQATSASRARACRSLLAALSRWAGEPQDGYAALQQAEYRIDPAEFKRAHLAAAAAVRDILCYGGPAQDTYAESLDAARKGDVRRCAELCTAAAAAHPDLPGPVRAAMESRAESARLVADFDSGQWVNLGAASPLAWNVMLGAWQHEPDRAVMHVGARASNLTLGTWANFGRRLEVEVDIAFPPEPGMNYGAGVTFGFEWVTLTEPRFQQVILYPRRGVGRVGSGINNRNVKSFGVNLRADLTARLSLRLDEDHVTVSVDGAKVYDGDVPPPTDSWKPGSGLGLWSSPTGFGQVVFSNLRVRRLAPVGDSPAK